MGSYRVEHDRSNLAHTHTQDFSEPLQTNVPCDSPEVKFSSQSSQVDLKRDPLPKLMFSAPWEALVVMSISPHGQLFQSCLALCDPMDYSPPGSSVHRILQAKILEWVAMPSSKGSSPPRDQTPVSYISCIGRDFLYHQHYLGNLKAPSCVKILSLNFFHDEHACIPIFLYFHFFFDEIN